MRTSNILKNYNRQKNTQQSQPMILILIQNSFIIVSIFIHKLKMYIFFLITKYRHLSDKVSQATSAMRSFKISAAILFFYIEIDG